ncbi:MAG: hypothetical protein ACR2KC_08010 [Acidimicrobiales bacterium]
MLDGTVGTVVIATLVPGAVVDTGVVVVGAALWDPPLHAASPTAARGATATVIHLVDRIDDRIAGRRVAWPRPRVRG